MAMIQWQGYINCNLWYFIIITDSKAITYIEMPLCKMFIPLEITRLNFIVYLLSYCIKVS